MYLLIVILCIDFGQMAQIQECKPFVDNLGTWVKDDTRDESKEIPDIDAIWTFTPKEETFYVQFTTDDADPKIQKLQKFSDEKCTKSSGNPLSVPEDIIEWDYENEICYVSKEPKQRASPSLSYCFSSSERSCCNYLQDLSVDSQFKSFIPEPCQRFDKYKELGLFHCIGCAGQTNDFILKSQATEDFAFVVNELYNVQNQMIGIQRPFNLEQKSSNGKTVEGYVKVCSEWLSRFWREDNVGFDRMKVKDPKKALANSTVIFDDCGTFDFHNDNKPIYIGRNFPQWQDALSFLEWVTLPLMPNFGIIVVDTMDMKQNLPKKEYNKIREYFAKKYPDESADQINQRFFDAIDCFNGDMRVNSAPFWAMSLIAMVYVI